MGLSEDNDAKGMYSIYEVDVVAHELKYLWHYKGCFTVENGILCAVSKDHYITR